MAMVHNRTADTLHVPDHDLTFEPGEAKEVEDDIVPSLPTNYFRTEGWTAENAGNTVEVTQ